MITFQVYINELTNSEDTVMSTHGYWCRVLATAERIAANCVFVAMLVEGIYLHRTIVAVFRKKLNIAWLNGIGAGKITLRFNLTKHQALGYYS